MRGRNTENIEMGKNIVMADYQGKRYVVMEFVNDEKYIAFKDIGKGRRRKEILDGIKVVVMVG